MSLKKTDFTVATDGTVCWLKEGENDPFLYDSNSIFKLFTIKLIALYASKNEFNYEDFFDYYRKLQIGKINDEVFEDFCESFRQEHHFNQNNRTLLNQLNNIFNQIISSFLVDGEKIQFYKPISHIGEYPGYIGFLNCIRDWGKNNIIHIHTLNHDLFFETFNYTDAINGELSDGFVELGSPFYGRLENGDKIRLSYFTGKYETNYRLYKLHGSLDQFPFHSMNGGQIDAYVKIKSGVGLTEFYKETVNTNGKLEYSNDFINYFPDFLSGTTSKILRYKDPVYYEAIFRNFESSLQLSDKLIVIGYGCGDSEINRIIFENFKGKVFVVDPYPSKRTVEFCDKTGAKLLKKNPDEMLLDDFG